MANVFQHEKFLKTFSFVHGGLLDEDWEFLNLLSHIEGPPLAKIHALKDMGNDLFRQNLVDPAGDCYDRASRLLCYSLEDNRKTDFSAVSNLAISLNLNLAACAIKLQAFEAAINFCSMVLYAFPSNVKALFRRGVAHMKLNKLLEARKDLEDASLIDGNNKDVIRELNVVKNLLAVNLNGKRVADDSLVNAGHNNKKSTLNVEENGVSVDIPTLVETSAISSCGSCVDVASSMENMDECSSNHVTVKDFDSCSGTDDMESTAYSKVSSEPRIFQFRKKGKDQALLKIDERSYQKLLAGKEVSFNQSLQFTIMKVRISKTHKAESTCEPFVKVNGGSRRRRRRRKRTQGGTRRKKISTDAMEHTNKSATTRNECNEEAIEETSASMTTSPSLKSMEGMESTTCEIATYDQPFVFASKCPKRRRISRTRHTDRLNSKGQGDESPGHSFGVTDTPSCFFPRTRYVSVSCRRYSFEALNMKKRSNISSSRSPQVPALKKRRLLVEPTPSFLACTSLVCSSVEIIAPHALSQVRMM